MPDRFHLSFCICPLEVCQRFRRFHVLARSGGISQIHFVMSVIHNATTTKSQNMSRKVKYHLKTHRNTAVNNDDNCVQQIKSGLNDKTPSALHKTWDPENPRWSLKRFLEFIVATHSHLAKHDKMTCTQAHTIAFLTLFPIPVLLITRIAKKSRLGIREVLLRSPSWTSSSGSGNVSSSTLRVCNLHTSGYGRLTMFEVSSTA